MAGHSRWAQVKHKKAGSDAKRSAAFAKLARTITVAAREGGGPNPEANTKLRQAIEQAREAGLPKDNIERAVARGRGPAGSDPSALSRDYEAYGPGGAALLIQTRTDNPNRTISDLKHILTEGGGKLAPGGGVSWLFERWVSAEFAAPPDGASKLELALIDAGAEETVSDGDKIRALLHHQGLNKFMAALSSHGLDLPTVTQIIRPKSVTTLAPSELAALQHVLRTLEGHPDVIEISTNAQV